MTFSRCFWELNPSCTSVYYLSFSRPYVFPFPNHLKFPMLATHHEIIAILNQLFLIDGISSGGWSFEGHRGWRHHFTGARGVLQLDADNMVSRVRILALVSFGGCSQDDESQSDYAVFATTLRMSASQHFECVMEASIITGYIDILHMLSNLSELLAHL